MQIADQIEENLEEFAYYETRDTGKPIGLSKKMYIPRAISNFRFFADHAKSFQFQTTLSTHLCRAFPYVRVISESAVDSVHLTVSLTEVHLV